MTRFSDLLGKGRELADAREALARVQGMLDDAVADVVKARAANRELRRGMDAQRDTAAALLVQADEARQLLAQVSSSIARSHTAIACTDPSCPWGEWLRRAADVIAQGAGT